ncbi:hypothetical protein DL95DRAFT_398858 [Leptodontidium sp. 2 PMI_412]|nr:hypothetical protein DL95DRAFT_398858 [Leptodontidium sp. 2 PMI_412]
MTDNRRCVLCQRVRPASESDSTTYACISCPVYCPTCKQYRSANDFSGRKTCMYPLPISTSRRASRKKGKPVSNEGRVRQFARAQRVIEEAMRNRLRLEKQKASWLEGRERWLQVDRWFGNWQLATFEKGPEYLDGPYRQWEGYMEPRERSCGYVGWEVPEGGWDGWKPQWPRLQEVEGHSQEVEGYPHEVENVFEVAGGMTPPREHLEHPDGEDIELKPVLPYKPRKDLYRMKKSYGREERRRGVRLCETGLYVKKRVIGASGTIQKGTRRAGRFRKRTDI